ncbi:dihydrolipoyl dehydrogenase family protein [Lacticaseibacillus salsurivasis]|uniref:dihydrolipoyl dehydrogenase family protein n=1 Tax=Lacticaseibacillus salsurivasis TaxID=3081441 RepID=UPI0030C67A45
MEKYDVIVIGGGPGGLAAAYPLAAGGKRVLVVERDLWGGTCPNYGCDPKKMLYSAVQAKKRAARMTRAGLVGIPDINWPNLMAFKTSYTETVPTGTRAGLVDQRIAVVDGEAHFVDEQTIVVGEQSFWGADIIIATGLQPVLPNVPGSSLVQTSRDFLEMPQMPQKIAFIGAGYVGMELANIAASAGAEVHIIMHGDRALRAFPAAAVTALETEMETGHVYFHKNVTLDAIEPLGNGVRLMAPDFTIDVQQVFAAMGRRPDDQLMLNRGRIRATPQGILVNDHLQTSNPHVYAIGDVVAKNQPKLTPVAGYEGRYVAAQILGDTEPISYPAIPVTVYGALEVAQVGLSEAEAKAAPDYYTVNTQDVTHWYTYNRTLEPHASVTIIKAKATDEVVGAVVVSSSAEDLINVLTVAINQHLTAEAVNAMIFAYPSEASDLSYLL